MPEWSDSRACAGLGCSVRDRCVRTDARQFTGGWARFYEAQECEMFIHLEGEVPE